MEKSMKKYVYLTLAFATAGAILSALLLFIHYQPGSPVSAAACSPSLPGSCENILNLPLSSIYGIPVAALGLAFYLSICFIILVADYASGIYLRFAAAIILCAGLFALAFDLVLASVLILERELCLLCVMTYLVSAAVTLTAFFQVKNFSREEKTTIAGFYKNTIKLAFENNSDRKAARSLLFLFLIMLAFSVISTERNMNIKFSAQKPQPEQHDPRISAFLERFYQTPAESPDFPQSSLIIGDYGAKMTIHVFIDFLCSACYNAYIIEEQILQKYGNQVRFVYYHYPLDAECNYTLTRTLFENACIASKAMQAAADLGFFSEYLKAHFSAYHSYRKNYSAEEALKIFRGLKTGHDENTFKQRMNSPEVRDRLLENIKKAKELNIRSTPTFYIASRKVIGAPAFEFIEAVIEEEFRRLR